MSAKGFKKPDDYPKWLNKPLGILILIISVGSAQVVSWGFDIYRRDNFTVIPMNEFESNKILVAIFSAAAIGLMLSVVLIGLVKIFWAIVKKGGQFNRIDWTFLLSIVFTFFSVFGVFELLEIEHTYHQIPHGDQVVENFFGCIIVGAVASVSGLFLFDFILKKLRVQ